MVSTPATIDYFVDQLADAGAVSARKMFGEYAIYCDGKLVALVCDDKLFVKPTAEGRAYAGEVGEAAPYPGAKPCLLIPGERWDDRDWMAGLIELSAAHLPAPSPKARRSQKNITR